MPPSPVTTPASAEPDNQLQFLGVPLSPSILQINNTKSFTCSFWAYHEVLQKPAGQNSWDGPKTLSGKDQFCPQHACGAEAFYIFVRTKNIGNSVPVSERGELAFTGNGPQVVNAGGIDQDGIGGVTSQGYHVPINTWIHIAGVLQAPSGTSPGVWQIYVDGDLKGEADALPELVAPGTEIFPTAPGIDMRFGNFRGINRPSPIATEANDYAYNGYLTGIRMYDHAQPATEIADDITADTPLLSLAQVSRVSSSRVAVAFQNRNPVPGFTHALVLLVEQDSAKDEWQLGTREELVDGIPFDVLEFQNASFPGGVNTAGREDDVGGTGSRDRTRLVSMIPGQTWTSTTYTILRSQPDTTPGDLEFYAVIAVVSVAAGRPVAQLGDIIVTPTLTFDV